MISCHVALRHRRWGSVSRSPHRSTTRRGRSCHPNSYARPFFPMNRFHVAVTEFRGAANVLPAPLGGHRRGLVKLCVRHLPAGADARRSETAVLRVGFRSLAEAIRLLSTASADRVNRSDRSLEGLDHGMIMDCWQTALEELIRSRPSVLSAAHLSGVSSTPDGCRHPASALHRSPRARWKAGRRVSNPSPRTACLPASWRTLTGPHHSTCRTAPGPAALDLLLAPVLRRSTRPGAAVRIPPRCPRRA
jgi:hypothetical protein